MEKPARIAAIDMLRGFVIALMALDHVRDFFGPTAFQPDDLAQTTPGWFWTRWVTHLCATTFVLLAGSSAFLRGQSKGIPSLSRYLATRGLMLLLLEMTWISFSWQFGYQVVILQVIWALGMGMIAMALLVWLPLPLTGLIGAALIASHNAFDGFNPGGMLWQAWHQGGFAPLPPSTHLQGIVFMYPLMPWIGLMAAGYALGQVFLWEQARRTRFLLLVSAGLLLLFVALRSGNWYGDPLPWKAQGKGWMGDFMAFMRLQKYPPSLLYLCITGSIGLALLAAFERIKPVPLLMLFGGSPLVFYVIHIALIHALGNAYFDLRFGGGPIFGNDGPIMPLGYTPSLLVVYGAWIVMLGVMAVLVKLWRRERKRFGR